MLPSGAIAVVLFKEEDGVRVRRLYDDEELVLRAKHLRPAPVQAQQLAGARKS